MISKPDGKGGLDIGGIRYMMIRPDALMGLFHRLGAQDRNVALHALADSVFEHGGKSAASYAGSGHGAALQLIARIEEIAPQIGWGQWQITLRDDGLDLEVENAPFVAGYGTADQTVCAPIRGMLAAITKQIFNSDAVVTEPRCAAVVGSGPCHFTSRIGPQTPVKCDRIASGEHF